MKNKIRFYGLLHLKDNENKDLNFKSSNETHKTLIYLKNAILLDKQLKHYGYQLILITNKKRLLERLVKNLKCEINLKSIQFKTFVPKKTHFYSCHFRVDVFNFLSKQKNVYSILVDLDILILNNPNKIIKLYKKKISLVNDITQNVIPAYGKKQILKNLQILNPNIRKIVWIGGDFFAGDNTFYKLLHNKAKFYQKKFVDNIERFPKQTDELFMSASLHDLKNNKLIKIKYGNKLNIFNRYWNTNVLHFQKKIENNEKFIFLHLPADKIFLSKCFNYLNKKQSFKLDYFKYVSSFRNILRIKIASYLPYKLKEKMKHIVFN